MSASVRISGHNVDGERHAGVLATSSTSDTIEIKSILVHGAKH